MLERDTPLTEALKAAGPALGAAFLISVFINLTLFVTPLYSMQVYDRVLSSRNLSTLAMLTLITAVFVALYGFLEYVRSGILVRGSLRFNEVLASPLFEMAIKARLAGREAGASRALKDADTLRDSLASGTISSLFDAPWSSGLRVHVLPAPPCVGRRGASRGAPHPRLRAHHGARHQKASSRGNAAFG